MRIMKIQKRVGSDGWASYFGEDKAKDVAVHTAATKSAGARYCDCPAYTIVAESLAKKSRCNTRYRNMAGADGTCLRPVFLVDGVERRRIKHFGVVPKKIRPFPMVVQQGSESNICTG